MSGATSRRKGADFERLVANRLKRVWPTARRRGGDQAGSHNLAAPDVDGTPFWIECKTGRSFSVKEAFAQADAARAKAADLRPIWVATRSHGSHVVTVWGRMEFRGIAFVYALLLDDWIAVHSPRTGKDGVHG